MASLHGTAVVCLKSHLLVFHSDFLYIYNEALVEETPGAQHDDTTGIPFPLHSLDLLAVNRNLLLCCPTPNTLAIYQFESDQDTGALKVPVLIAKWAIPEEIKISVACWALSPPSPSPPSASESSNTSASSYQSQHVFLGTRDGTVLRLDLEHPGDLHPVNIDGLPSSLLQSATISCIAAAPCGDGYYAVSYVSGLIAIYQSTEEGLKTVHSIETPKKVLALSWHYSCKNKTSQSLATLRAGNDRLHIYTINLASPSTPPRKIRDIPLPFGQSVPSICSKFLQWSKSGKVVRVSDSGLVVSDVRTKKVTSRSISLPPPAVTLDVRSSAGKAWVVDCEGRLCSYNLMDGSLINSATLPFFLSLQESATILDSPVVFLHRPTQVNTVTYKNKRALKSPLNESQFPKSDAEHQLPSFQSPKQYQNASPTLVTRYEDKNLKSHHPTCSVSSLLSNASTLPGNTSIKTTNSTIDMPTNLSHPIHLSMLPVKAVVNSLFPSVLKTLSRMPQHQDVPEYIPSLSTREQYAISAIFGGVYSTSLCLGGILDILSHAISKDSGSFKSLIFSLLLADISVNQLTTALNNLPGKRKYSDRFVMTLLSINSVAGGARDSASAYSSSSAASTNSYRRTSCNTAVVNLVQELVNSQEEDFPTDDIHLICSYLVSMGYTLEARTIYLNSRFFLEAFVVSLLGRLEFISVFRDWCSYLRSASLNPNLLSYLSDVCTNISGVPRNSTTSSSGSSLDDGPTDDQYLVSRLTGYSLTSEHPDHNIIRTTELTGSCAIDDVAIFTPEHVSEDYSTSTLHVHTPTTRPPVMSPNRIKMMSTPKSIHRSTHSQRSLSHSSASSPPLDDVNMAHLIPPLTRLTLTSNNRG